MAAQITSVYNQLMFTWNNLDWQFQVHISKPKKSTTMQDFLDMLEVKALI